MEDTERKRRRIAVDEDDEDDDNDPENEEGSNPDELVDDQSEEEDGEDLMENLMADYAPAPELDQYDQTLLARDDEVQETYLQQIRSRREADEAMDADEERRRQQMEQAEDEMDENMDAREQQELDQFDEDEEDEEGEPDEAGIRQTSLNLEAFECPLREWIAGDRTRQEIKRRFGMFLRDYYPGIDEVTRFEKKYGPEAALPPHLKRLAPIYPPKISAMGRLNKSSLEVSYGHLGEMQSLLAIWLTDVPRDLLNIFDEVFRSEVCRVFPQYLENISSEVHVRIVSLPLADRLRDLRQGDLNNLIRVSGVVTRRTGVMPQVRVRFYDCNQCNQLIGPFTATGGTPSKCLGCQGTGSFRLNEKKTIYGNYQRLTLQESPGSVPAGRVPRYKDITLLGDLIDIARPGEEIEVTGIYVHSQQDVGRDRSGFPTFSTVIEANSVQKKNGASNTDLSDEDKRKIRELATDKQIGERIIRSIAPSIYGHRHVKTAVALSLFGGCAKEGGSGGTHRVRGDINILLLGDPGTAKSQMLKYAEKIAPRAVYSTGKGASAVGLTAGVRRDPMTGEWTLEGGALVLADQGVCLIDEFDKMNEQDRTSIHEAMEQQTISVSKAGIVTSLQARCAVLAAANPIGGRYDASYAFAENVELTDPILQRFDVLCVLQDIVDPVVDQQLALFVVNSHIRSHPDAGALDGGVDDDDDDDLLDMLSPPGSAGGAAGGAAGAGCEEGAGRKGESLKDSEPQPLDQQMLKKYITYARAHCKPILHDIDSEKIASLYAELRQQSAISGGVPIAVRHIESVMRMAEASARMHLRDHVREDDVDMAIKVMLESFLQAQKVSVRKTLQRSFRKYITFGEETHQLLMHQLQGFVLREEKYKTIKGKDISESTEVPMHELENKAKELNIFDLRPFYASQIFKSHGFSINETRQVIVKTY